MYRSHKNHPSLDRQTKMRSAIVAAIAIAFNLSSPAHAFQFDTEDSDSIIRWDNTVRYTLAQRTQAQNHAIISTLNSNDGDRNFDRGSLVNNRLDLLSEFDWTYKKQHGIRISAAAWYDQAYKGRLDNTSLATSNNLVNGVPTLGFTPYTKRFYAGPSGEILDAFVFTGFNAGDMPVAVKAGQHALFWGEGLLLGGAIHGVSYGMSSIDAQKAFAMPGVDAKELFRPRKSISINAQPTNEITASAVYAFAWEAARLPESGTFISNIDPLQNGGNSVIAAPGKYLVRIADSVPNQRGDYGLMLKWAPQELDATMGLYYRKFADVLPQLMAIPAIAGLPAATCGALGYAALGATTCYVNPAAASLGSLSKGTIGQYMLAYPKDIELLGASVSKEILGVGVGAEINYRRNMPLVSNTVNVLPTALAALTPGSISAIPTNGNTGGALGNTWHAVVNALGVLNRTPVFDGGSWNMELTWNRWASVTQNMAVFKGANNYNAIDKVSKDAWSFAFNISPTWYQVLPGIDLSAPIGWSGGIAGNSAVANGGNSGAGTFNIGLNADAYLKYNFDLRYIGYFGKWKRAADGSVAVADGGNALLKDRGRVAFTFKTTF